MNKVVSVFDVVVWIVDDVVVIVFFFLVLGCFDFVFKVIGVWFDVESYLCNLMIIYLIVVGDMYGVLGVDYIVKDGFLLCILGGFYLLGFLFKLMFEIWKMIVENCVVVYNVFFGVLFDMICEVVVNWSGVLIKVGMEIFVDFKC